MSAWRCSRPGKEQHVARNASGVEEGHPCHGMCQGVHIIVAVGSCGPVTCPFGGVMSRIPRVTVAFYGTHLSLPECCVRIPFCHDRDSGLVTMTVMLCNSGAEGWLSSIPLDRRRRSHRANAALVGSQGLLDHAAWVVCLWRARTCTWVVSQWRDQVGLIGRVFGRRPRRRCDAGSMQCAAQKWLRCDPVVCS
jgi:hypothetical protein